MYYTHTLPPPPSPPLSFPAVTMALLGPAMTSMLHVSGTELYTCLTPVLMARTKHTWPVLGGLCVCVCACLRVCVCGFVTLHEHVNIHCWHVLVLVMYVYTMSCMYIFCVCVWCVCGVCVQISQDTRRCVCGWRRASL